MKDLETYPAFENAIMNRTHDYKPFGMNVLTKQHSDIRKKNSYGLITNLGGTIEKKPEIAEIVSMGSDVTDLKIGNKVFFSRYAGIRLKVDGEDYLLLSRNEIFGMNPNMVDIKMGETKDLLGIMETIGHMVEGD